MDLDVVFNEKPGDIKSIPLIREPVDKYLNAYMADAFQLTNLTERMKMTMDSGPWVVGGAVRKIVMNEPVMKGDIDIVFKSMGQLRLFQERFVRVHKSGGWTRHQYSYMNGNVSLNFRQFYKDVPSIFQDFDLTVCQFATDGIEIIYPERSMVDALKGNLRDAGNARCPEVYRVIKYIGKGFTPVDEFTSETFSNFLRTYLFWGVGRKLDEKEYIRILNSQGVVSST